MEEKTGILKVVRPAESEMDNMGMFSENSKVPFVSTGIDWTADGTDNAGWTTKSYTEL